MRTRFLCGLVVLGWLLPTPGFADSGQEISRGSNGQVRWYLYAESPGLVIGEGRLGVLLEKPQGGVLLASALRFRLEAPDGSVQTRLSRPGFADNLLLQGVPFFAHQVGVWKLHVREVSADGHLLFAEELRIESGGSPWQRAWPWLAFPALAVALFGCSRPLRKASPRNREP